MHQHEAINTGETILPFELKRGDGDFIARALKAYRPQSKDEGELLQFFIEQFAKFDPPYEDNK